MSQLQMKKATTPIPPEPEQVIERFRQLFNRMSARELGDLGQVYSEDVRFTDPFKTVTGLEELHEYFAGAYANVIDCRFEFGSTVCDGSEACLTWVMKLRHKRIRGGELIQVDGISHLKVDNDRIILHRDYFDAGQLLYENLPVLGSAVRWLRRYAS